jgi:predicted AAA+ superfamily ATPase
MDGLKRYAANKISKLLETFAVVVILGPRQCGKTTLSRMIAPAWKYFDLQNPNVFDRVNSDPVLFFRENPTHCIIDEAQELPKLFNVLRGVVDTDPKLKGRFLLTGSASFDLIKSVSESLAGRVATVELAPMKMSELNLAPLSPLYEIFKSKIDRSNLSLLKDLRPTSDIATIKQRILAGGYPEPALSKDMDFHADWMESYFNTYINRDMRMLYPGLDVVKYRRVVAMLSSLSGTIVNRSEVARSVEASEKTCRDYLDIISGTYFWRDLPGFVTPKIKTTLKLPKGHFRDSGLNLFLQNVNTVEEFDLYPRLGNVFESFIVEELIRGIEVTTAARNLRFSHFRTKAGGEIDLIVQGNFGMLPIEVKYQSHTAKKNLTSLSNFIELHSLPYGIVINNCEAPSMITDKIIELPAACV